MRTELWKKWHLTKKKNKLKANDCHFFLNGNCACGQAKFLCSVELTLADLIYFVVRCWCNELKIVIIDFQHLDISTLK